MRKLSIKGYQKKLHQSGARKESRGGRGKKELTLHLFYSSWPNRSISSSRYSKRLLVQASYTKRQHDCSHILQYSHHFYFIFNCYSKYRIPQENALPEEDVSRYILRESDPRIAKRWWMSVIMIYKCIYHRLHQHEGSKVSLNFKTLRRLCFETEGAL